MQPSVSWAPRILGILIGLFLGLFALDAWGEGAGALLRHLLPTLLILLVVAVAWRWEWVGGVAFLAFAASYAAMTLHRPDWILVISGPLTIVGGLYLWSWSRSRRR